MTARCSAGTGWLTAVYAVPCRCAAMPNSVPPRPRTSATACRSGGRWASRGKDVGGETWPLTWHAAGPTRAATVYPAKASPPD